MDMNTVVVGFSDDLAGKEERPPAMQEDQDLLSGSRRYPREGNGHPPQYSCLGNPMHRGAWWVIVHGVARA